MWAFIIMALGGLAVIVGAYFQYRNRMDDQKSALVKEQTRQKESEQRATEAESILKKATDIIVSQKEVIDQTEKITELQNKLAEKNNEIIKLQNTAIAQTTGGDGYPFIHHGIYVNSRELSFRLQNNSEYPIYDLKISYTDPNKRDEINKKKPFTEITDDDYNYYHITQQIGNVTPGIEKEIFIYKMSPFSKHERIVFVMYCRNGHYLQTFEIEQDQSYIYIVHGKLEKVENGTITKVIKKY